MAGNDMNVEMDTVPRMVAARLPVATADDPAVIVLGERLHGLLVALGVPPRDWLGIARRLDVANCRDAIGGYVDVLVADRCRCPGEDLVSDLVAVEVDGGGLTADEIRAIVVDLLTS
ncbi:hypothetical protein ACAG24_017260 [Mycobacterium sp. pW049]|uniref:hypothetical protein n=1 Tax=[Mycobacterium] bulgaricum TaxID=3238985 RepID=UPI00351B27AC